MSEKWTIERVYGEQFRFVWRCLRNLGVSEASVDDAVQEVFLVVDRKLGEFSGQLRPWLFAIVRRIAHRYRKRALQERNRFVDESLSESVREPAHTRSDLRDDVEQRETLDLAFRALERLDEQKREVFVFCMIEGFSAPEVSKIVGIPQNTVYSRLRVARQEFASLVLDQKSELGTRPESSPAPTDPPALRSQRRQS